MPALKLIRERALINRVEHSPAFAAANSSESGSASLEFITAGIVLLVPLVYLVLAMASLQGAALSVEGGARQAARVFVQAPSESIAIARANSAADIALHEFRISGSDGRVTITCRPVPTQCLTRRAYVTVRVVAWVSLPLAPTVLTIKAPWMIPLSATSTEQVSRFWGETG